MANIFRLGRGAVRKVNAHVDQIFNAAKARLLGPYGAKDIRVHYTRELSLPGLFEAGAMEEGVRPDLDVLKSLLDIAGGYIDAVQERTKARIVNEINSVLGQARHGGLSRDDYNDLLKMKLSEVFGDVTQHIHAIVDTEATRVKNISVLDGIIGSNLSSDVSDPVVFFVVVRDGDLCGECKRLHLMPDGITPRLWYLSECGHGYHKKGESDPKIGGLHPHCRCTLVTLMPGFGFSSEGKIMFIKRGHLELPVQRGEGELKKTEPFDPNDHPRDPETGEFTPQIGADEMLPSDPDEREKEIADRDAWERYEESLVDHVAVKKQQIINIREEVEDGLLQPNSQAIEKEARRRGVWSENPAEQEATIRAILGLSKGEAIQHHIRSARPASEVRIPLARRIRNQARVEHNLHGDPPPDNENWPLPNVNNLNQLLRAAKNKTDSWGGQALRYAIHRIEHVKDYETPAGAKEADKLFTKNEEETRDRKGAYVDPYGLYPIYNLRSFVADNPHVIGELVDGQKRLHAALLPHAIMIGNKPHVALVRRYPHPEKQPESVLASYSDSSTPDGAGSGGVSLTHPFYHFVPLENIWHSYDFGDAEAHIVARRTAQSEFLVSPHQMVDARPEDLRKLFSAAPKATVTEVGQLPEHFRLPAPLFRGGPTPKRFDKISAGAIIYAKDTGRFLIGHRSKEVDDPGTWGTWGGQIHPNEDPLKGAHREFKEESQYEGAISLHPILSVSGKDKVHKTKVYHNFLGVVEHEFEPKLNWEHQGAKWFSPNDLPKPLHPGLARLMAHPNFRAALNKLKPPTNLAKTEQVFRTAKTQRGTVIKRSKLGVGKDIGGAIYLHRDYEGHIPDQEGLLRAKQVLDRNHPGFKYNALKVAKDKFTFFNSPDFDTAHEPVAGNYITVSGDKSKAGNTSQIWHHKWLWVKEGYRGFDVDASHRRSLAWLKIPNIDFARIGNKEFWESKYVPKIPTM